MARHADNRKIWLNVRDRFPHPYTLGAAESWVAMVTAADPETQFAIEVDGEAAGGIGVFLQEDVSRYRCPRRTPRRRQGLLRRRQGWDFPRARAHVLTVGSWPFCPYPRSVAGMRISIVAVLVVVVAGLGGAIPATSDGAGC